MGNKTISPHILKQIGEKAELRALKAADRFWCAIDFTTGATEFYTKGVEDGKAESAELRLREYNNNVSLTEAISKKDAQLATAREVIKLYEGIAGNNCNGISQFSVASEWLDKNKDGK